MTASAPDPDAGASDGTSTSTQFTASQPATTDPAVLYSYQMAQVAAYQAWQAQIAAAQTQLLSDPNSAALAAAPSNALAGKAPLR